MLIESVAKVDKLATRSETVDSILPPDLVAARLNFLRREYGVEDVLPDVLALHVELAGAFSCVKSCSRDCRRSEVFTFLFLRYMSVEEDREEVDKHILKVQE